MQVAADDGPVKPAPSSVNKRPLPRRSFAANVASIACPQAVDAHVAFSMNGVRFADG